jgi:hypothetical protein
MLYSLHDTEKYRFRFLGCCIGYNAVFFKTRLEVHELFSEKLSDNRPSDSRPWESSRSIAPYESTKIIKTCFSKSEIKDDGLVKSQREKTLHSLR